MIISPRVQPGTLILCISAAILFFSQPLTATVLHTDQSNPLDNASLLQQTEPFFFQDDIPRHKATDISLLLWLARNNLNSGHYKQARVISEQVLANKEFNVEALALFAAAHKGLGDQKSYLRVSNRIKQLAPQSPALSLALATVYRVEKNFDAAEQVYLDGLKTVLNPADLRMELARLYQQQKRFNEAGEQYQQALKQQGLSLKHTLNANFALCRLDLKNKEFNKVRNRANELIESYPPFPQSYQLLASAYLAEGETSKAISTYERLITANPKSPLPFQELTIITLDHLKNNKKAVSYAKQGLKRFPNDAKTRDVLGWVYFKQGNPEEASIQFQAATRLEADNSQFFYHLGLAHQQLGNKNKAKSAYQRSLGLINQAQSSSFKDELNKRIKAITE